MAKNKLASPARSAPKHPGELNPRMAREFQKFEGRNNGGFATLFKLYDSIDSSRNGEIPGFRELFRRMSGLSLDDFLKGCLSDASDADVVRVADLGCGIGGVAVENIVRRLLEFRNQLGVRASIEGIGIDLAPGTADDVPSEIWNSLPQLTEEILANLPEDLKGVYEVQTGTRKRFSKLVESNAQESGLLKDGQYDLIIGANFLQYVADILKLLRRSYDALKPGGGAAFIGLNAGIMGTPDLDTILRETFGRDFENSSQWPIRICRSGLREKIRMNLETAVIIIKADDDPAWRFPYRFDGVVPVKDVHRREGLTWCEKDRPDTEKYQRFHRYRKVSYHSS